MKVMVLTPYLPHARVGHGGGTAVRGLVRTLSRRHRVLVVSLLRPGEADAVADVAALGAEVVTVPFADAGARGAARLALYAGRAAAWLRSRRSGYPLYVEKYRTAAVARQVVAATERFAPDAVQVEYLQSALLLRDLRAWRDGRGAAGPRLVLNSHELGSLPRERRAAAAADAGERRRELAEAARWRRLQVDATGWADTTLCVTPEDHDLYAAMGGRNLRTVPLGIDTEAVQAVWAPAADEPETHLFVASFSHRPNRLAAELLVTRIWPLVRTARPRARLLLAGRGSQEFLAGLPAAAVGPGVTALGFVEDLVALYRSAAVVVAPLPEGGGIKIKILEALAHGVPVVTTPVGAEGITAAADGAAVIAPPDERFAAALVAALEDPAALRELSRRGRRLVEEKFSWSAIADTLEGIYRAGG
ncbi:MAG: glycosyltransferase family 4 protein [Candidatus Krumholzibacteriia bacterium]